MKTEINSTNEQLYKDEVNFQPVFHQPGLKRRLDGFRFLLATATHKPVIRIAGLLVWLITRRLK